LYALWFLHCIKHHNHVDLYEISMSLNNAWLREYCSPICVPELEPRDSTNTASAPSYLELHPEQLTVRVVQKIVNQRIKIMRIKKIKMSSQGSQSWLRSPMSSQGSQTWLSSPMSSQGNQTWLGAPMSERGDPYL
jgi:hypothetical protein